MKQASVLIPVPHVPFSKNGLFYSHSMVAGGFEETS